MYYLGIGIIIMYYYTAGDVCYEDVSVKVNTSGTAGKLN